MLTSSHPQKSNIHDDFRTSIRDAGIRENSIETNRNNRIQTEWMLAISATIHCLIGCGIGEVSGMMIGSAYNLSNSATVIWSVLLSITGGLLLGLLPLKRHGFSLRKAFKTVVLGEGLSILVMTAVDVTVEASIPGVMNAHLTDWLFWAGMLVGLVSGFVVALPVNYVMIRRGMGHRHSQAVHHMQRDALVERLKIKD